MQRNRLVGIHKSAIGGIVEIPVPKSSINDRSGNNQQVMNLLCADKLARALPNTEF